MSLLQNSNAIETGGYPIQNSLRFQQASSQSLTRTPSSSGSQTTFTHSIWLKRGLLSSSNYVTIYGSESSGSNYVNCAFLSDTLYWTTFNGSTNITIQTTQVFRDVSAWYHLVIAVDTTQATASNRVKIYINGSQVTAGTFNYPSQNQALQINTASFTHKLGFSLGFGQYFDGYMTEVNFIDGQALTPSSFGETNTLTGQWVAKKYTGTYGTNGFYLPFSNGTSTTTLGADSSGNGNNWTLTNFTRSAGVSDCWMYDVPSGNGSSVGGTQPNSNYCVLNPLAGTNTLSRANLQTATASTGTPNTFGTMAVSSGKWYWEFISIADAAVGSMVGIATTTTLASNGFYTYSTGYGYYSNTGQKFNNNTGASYGSTWTTNDVIGVALDLDAGTITFYKNNVSQGTAYTGLSGEFTAAITDGGTGTVTVGVNFGQRSFAYTPPSGFKALCTANLPTSTIVKGNQFMDATLFTGNGSTQTITNAGGFQPDLVWIKSRSSVQGHGLYNPLMSGFILDTSSTAAQQAVTPITFNSSGWTMPDAVYNNNGVTYVGWQWDAGSSTVTNTSGTISSQVRANPTAGVSVVTYTGTGANATVGHGLGVAPKMVIVKRRDNGIGATNWWVYHAGVNNGVNPQQYNLKLNLTNAQAGLTAAWNDTAPTSSVFTVGTSTEINGSGGTFVAYTFAEIAGFSKFGSYTGNGSADGPFVYTGFRPKFVMVKRTDSTGSWGMQDTERLGYNPNNRSIYANSSAAEDTNSPLDILSNGFKLRASDSTFNANGGTYIYACFAESPFANSNSR